MTINGLVLLFCDLDFRPSIIKSSIDNHYKNLILKLSF